MFRDAASRISRASATELGLIARYLFQRALGLGLSSPKALVAAAA